MVNILVIVILKDKLTVTLTTIKILISVFITYLILIKGDAGAIIYHIGTFFIGGNYIIGLSSMANATALYVLAMYNLTINYTHLKKLKQSLLLFDFALVIINLALGLFIGTTRNQMLFDDAISKFIILATGSAVVYYTISLLVVLLIRKFQPNAHDNLESDLNTNNNPFSFVGKIARKSYFITKASMLVIFLGAISIIKIAPLTEYSIMLMTILIFIAFSVGLFAASKRLRDIKWSQLILIIWAIPFLGLAVGIPLLFIKSK